MSFVLSSATPPTATAGTLQSLHALFERQSFLRPEAVALTFGEAQMTYAELNTRSNRLAHYLQQLGVKPETPVALYLDRSFETVIAILAVLKAGGTYVPIDLSYPKQRAEFILQDTATSILLTTTGLEKALDVSVKRICLDAEAARIAREPDRNPLGRVTPANAAYIIFTSGSTGQPKGVIVTHDNVMRLLGQTEHWYGFNDADVWPLFHSYAFDVSVWELWGCLAYGGRLVIVPHLVTRAPHEFYDLLSLQGVTVLNQTPSAFRQLIWAEETAPRKHHLKLRYVICAGEALELQSLRPWFERHGDQRPLIVNMYGITETTVHSTYRPIRISDLDNPGSPVGVPIPDLKIYLLDPDLQPVPAGQPGEIYVSGPGVARGYLKRPELSAARFLPDHFSSDPGSRMYRSGDLAKINAAGELEYLGRMDFQVKIRGFRVELGEIESALNRHCAIRESCVLARDSGAGEIRLVAYIVPIGKAPTITELRQQLLTALPEYMVPATFIFLDKLPLNTNGKVDRKALPHSEGLRPNLENKFRAPTTRIETLLAEIWSEVLELERVGIDDNFYELGGDSIRSIRVLGRARSRGLYFTLQQILDHPTIADLAKALRTEPPSVEQTSVPFEGLSASDKQSLRSDVEDAYPVASLQLGMFYHNEIEPRSAIYHDVFSFAIRAAFDRDRLLFALEQLLERHPTLRSSFQLAGYTTPLQLVHRSVKPNFTFEDLRALSPSRQTEAVARWVEQEKRKPFDRSQPSLIRFHVQQQSALRFHFFISFHHACMDGWSLAAVVTEIFQDYASLLESGEPAGISAPIAKYREFIALEQATLRNEVSQTFWEKTLAEAPGQRLPRWPKSMRGSGLEQSRGPEVEIPQETLEKLKKLAAESGVSLKSVLLTAHQEVMRTLTGQEDVISGLVANGRPEVTDGEKIVGLFLNTIPFRSRQRARSWKDSIRQAFITEREITPHRRYPIAELHKANHGEALFESAFDFVHFHVYESLAQAGGLDLQEGHYFEANNLVTYTTFMLDPAGKSLRLHIDYDPNQICLRQVESFNSYYINILKEMACNPAGEPKLFSPLGDLEKRQILQDWNATQTAYPSHVCLNHLIEKRSREQPEAVAVIGQNVHLSYGELETYANRLAQDLISRGAQTGQRIGVFLDRSPEMLVGLLGVLKSGAAYVPLDPAYPASRLQFMLEDSQAMLILTQPGLAAKLPAANVPLAYLENVAKNGETTITPAPHADVGPEDLAYVIYTSGSTGTPKGVEISHRSLVNLLSSAATKIGFTGADHLLAVTTLSFDIAMLELFMPLITGARLTIAPQRALADPGYLADLLCESRATVMQATPSTWSMLVDTGWNGNPGLKIICGGEALQPALAEALTRRSAAAWNFYGPTETTVWSTAWRIQAGEPVSIGRPLANTRTYVLNPDGQPLPPGVTGELYLAGDGLARGYHQRPELTSERFIPEPFNQAKGRMYRTGDLARYFPDGNIECLGRVDHQVKIRGHRIELGEVQAALRTNPEINDAVVTARPDPTGNRHLVAYLVSENPPKPEALRKYLHRLLPDFMIPAHFVALQRLPLTPNGKVDLQRLPAPGLVASSEKSYAPPRTRSERTLAAIWQEVLLLPEIGIDDNFFESGGDSLSATRVFARIKRSFETDLTLRQLFDHPTIRKLGGIIGEPQNVTKLSAIPRQPRQAA